MIINLLTRYKKYIYLLFFCLQTSIHVQFTLFFATHRMSVVGRKVPPSVVEILQCLPIHAFSEVVG